MKKTILTLCMILALLVSCAALPAQAADGTTEIVIYHTNDTHGYLQGDGSAVIGIDTVAALKKSTPGSILVDAGDATQGLPLASLTRGADVIELMNLAGYDLMTPGNHEFDFGAAQFLQNAEAADFPLLAANVLRDGQPLLKGVQENGNGCRVILEREDLSIGFFGLTTADTATSALPEGIAGLTFADEITTANQEIEALEEAGADVIIAVCHLGTTDASCTSTKLAEATGGKIDVIIDGHSHTIENRSVNGTLIVQTGSQMSAVGKLTLTFQDGSMTAAADTLLTPKDVAEVTPDAAVSAKLAEINATSAALLEEPIAQTETTLWAGNVGGTVAITRMVETNYGNLVADAFRSAAETLLQSKGDAAELPVVAVENGGGIRTEAANGVITMGDLIAAFPFSNTLYLKQVTPAILYEVMENAGKELDGQDKETGLLLQGTNFGGFLQVSGCTVVYDPDAPAGSRVTSITLDSQSEPLDRTDTATPIMLVGNNYIMTGGNHYDMLAALPKYAEAGGELETIQNYLESCLKDGVLQGYAGTEGRIRMQSAGYQPRDYTASLLITDEDGRPLANQSLSYRIDGGARQNGKTDENGILLLTLADGAHGVRLADDQQEVYVDNYTGFGIIEDAYRPAVALTFLSDGSCDPIDTGSQPEGKPETDPNPGTDPNPDTDPEPETDPETGAAPDEKSPATGGRFPIAACIAMAGSAVLLVLTASRKRGCKRL